MNEWRQVSFTSSGLFGKTRCGSNWSWRQQSLDDYDLWYVLAGTGEIKVNGERFRVREGTCCLLRPGDSVHASQDDDAPLTVIYMHFWPLDEDGYPLADCPAFPRRRVQVQERFWLEQYLHALLEFAGKDDPFSRASVDQLLRLTLTQLLYWQEQEDKEEDGRHRHTIHKVQDYMQIYIHRSVTREDLARLVSLSPRYLSRLFKQYAGMSLKEYMKRARLERARKLLLETERNITFIAESLGYKDIYLFSNQFKQQYGVSPMLYRANMRKARAVSIPIVK